MSDFTTYDLERMAAGEIETPAEATERVAALRGANARVLERYPETEFVPLIRAASPDPVSPPRRAPAVLALVGMLTVVVAGVWLRPENPAVEPRVRVKGAALRLQVYKQTDEGEVRLSDGDTVGAGEIVQAKFGLDRPSWIALYSIDGANVVTPLDPPEIDGEARRYDGGTHVAPTATELDDAPDFERFILVSCPKPFIAADLVARLKEGTDPAPCVTEKLELRKR